MTGSSPSTRALIVVDVQNDYDGGALPIVHPPFRDGVAAIGRAIDAANAAGIAVYVVVQIAPETSPMFARGSHGGALHPVVASRPRTRLVEKALPSAFAGTELEAELRAAGIERLTVVGYMTHNCVLSTVIDAAHRGFAVEVLADATGTLPYANSAGRTSAEEMQRVVLTVCQARFAAVASTDAWIAAVTAGGGFAVEGVAASAKAGAA
jgi:nicotinamidase-related amidase